MFSNVLPLRAIIFQFLFLLVAIVLEAFVLRRTVGFDYKISMQYSITVNLLSTFIGWLIFFNIQPILPEELRAQLISYVFFERFFDNSWLVSVAPILILLSLGMFLGTYIVKLKGLELLEFVLERSEKVENKPDEKAGRFRGRKAQVAESPTVNRAYAVLLANAVSFSAILILLLVRLLEQNQNVLL